MTHILTVSDVFTIQGRGIVLVPGLIPVGSQKFTLGDPLILNLPDGSSVRVTIHGLNLPTPNPRKEVLVLLANLTCSDVPSGTEVWSDYPAHAE